MNAPQDNYREVTQKEFYEAMSPLDVHPSLQGRWPFTSFFKTRTGSVRGKVVFHKHFPEQNRYYLPTLTLQS